MGATAVLWCLFYCPFALWRDTPPMTAVANAYIGDYYDAETFKRNKELTKTKETPFVVIDTATINRQYDELVDGFPYAKVYYAVKANPAPQILTMLRDKGANFDIASVYELDKVMSLGVTGDRISYGNTIKKEIGRASCRKECRA